MGIQAGSTASQAILSLMNYQGIGKFEFRGDGSMFANTLPASVTAKVLYWDPVSGAITQGDISSGTQGPQGAQGAQGHQGARGYQGYQGYQGAQGSAGAGASSRKYVLPNGSGSNSNMIGRDVAAHIIIEGNFLVTRNNTFYGYGKYVAYCYYNGSTYNITLNKLIDVPGSGITWTVVTSSTHYQFSITNNSGAQVTVVDSWIIYAQQA